LPQNFDLDALVERLIFIEKVEVGLAQLDRGESKTQEEVEQLVKSWRK
jgi:predicted transcriptional regulator